MLFKTFGVRVDFQSAVSRRLAEVIDEEGLKQIIEGDIMREKIDRKII